MTSIRNVKIIVIFAQMRCIGCNFGFNMAVVETSVVGKGIYVGLEPMSLS